MTRVCRVGACRVGSQMPRLSGKGEGLGGLSRMPGFSGRGEGDGVLSGGGAGSLGFLGQEWDSLWRMWGLVGCSSRELGSQTPGFFLQL